MHNGGCYDGNILDKCKKSFLLNEGDIGMANYEKQVEQEAAYPKKKNMMTEIRKSRMSDFSCEETKVCLDS